MKTKLFISFIFSVVLVCVFFAGSTYGEFRVRNSAYYKSISYKTKLIKAYRQYNAGVEQLLDELDSAYNWVDGYDNYDYYAGKHKVDSLNNLERLNKYGSLASHTLPNCAPEMLM